MTLWMRNVVVALACGALALVLRISDCGLLEGFFATIISIVNASGIGMAVYFLTISGDAAEKTIPRLNRLRKTNDMPELNSAEHDQVIAVFSRANEDCRRNAVALVVLLGVAASAIIWSRSDIPWITWPGWKAFSKLQCVHSLIFTATGLSLLSVYDLTVSSFELAKLNFPDTKAK